MVGEGGGLSFAVLFCPSLLRALVPLLLLLLLLLLLSVWESVLESLSFSGGWSFAFAFFSDLCGRSAEFLFLLPFFSVFSRDHAQIVR